MFTNIYRNFPNTQMIFEKYFYLAIWFNSLGLFCSPILNFCLKFSHDAKGISNPSTYPSWGSDTSAIRQRTTIRPCESSPTSYSQHLPKSSNSRFSGQDGLCGGPTFVLAGTWFNMRTRSTASAYSVCGTTGRRSRTYKWKLAYCAKQNTLFWLCKHI